MFKKIDIKKFGLYKDFRWTGNLPELKRLNIIYGRNYCGKTTLSRIFDSAGQGQLPKKYQDGEFTLYTDDDSVPEVTEKTLSKCPYMVRVYNSDFVRRNLSWLNNEEEGEIKPFALLGASNKAAQEEIDKINKELGSEEERTGLRYDLAKQNKAWNKWNHEHKQAQAALDKQLKDKANLEIKIDKYFVKNSNTYNVAALKNDISCVRNRKNHKKWKSLSKTEQEWLKLIIDEEVKSMMANLPTVEPHLDDWLAEVSELVHKKIQMTKVLTELVENDFLQAWVNKGREVNEGRKTCAFCGSPISDERWEQLNAHFSKESDDLSQRLRECRTKLERAADALDDFLEARGFVEKNVYAAYAKEFQAVMADWKVYVAAYKTTVSSLIQLIDKRLSNLFKPVDEPMVDMAVFSTGKRYKDLVADINGLIGKNNTYSRDMETKKQETRDELRLHAIDNFCQIINYDKEQKRLDKESADMFLLADQIGQLKAKIQEKEALIMQKELEKKDERLAAQNVTKLLLGHFGNGSISLDTEMDTVAVEDYPNAAIPLQTKFVVKRGGQYANNLSEGEKSLIAFCYFITQIDNELKGPDADKLVIFIDDPISSLDSNHIFFMYSLIDAVIAEPRKYGQLFISTHNLEFLKFLKRIDLPGAWGKKDISHYVVVKSRRGDTDDYKSEIMEMPSYLKNYVTEYNFLFQQIYEIASPVTGDKQALYGNKYSQYYNIGNNMRKFMECYLFYRYPDTDDPIKKHMKQLFDGHVPSEVNRVVNEYSHLTWAERGLRVVDVPEIEKVAILILKALQTKDPEHYETLCKSVGVDEKVIF